MSNKVDQFYCNSCGYEDFDIEVAYSRQTADDNYYRSEERRVGKD